MHAILELLVHALDSEDTDEERKDALIGILEGMTVMHVFTRDSDKTDLKLEIT